MTLTPRQFEILRLSADGLTCHAIGRKLFIGENTVRTHRKAVIKRLGAKTAAHAVAIAYEQGILVSRQLDSARAWAVELEQELAHLRETGCLPVATTNTSVDINGFARSSAAHLEEMSKGIRQRIQTLREEAS